MAEGEKDSGLLFFSYQQDPMMDRRTWHERYDGRRTLQWRFIPRGGAGKGDSHAEGMSIGPKGRAGWIKGEAAEEMCPMRKICKLFTRWVFGHLDGFAA